MQSTAPKPFVFVLMPFAPEFDDAYQLSIKAACQEAGTYCERLDEQIFHENMLERIYNQISKADIIIADMSGKNPNVFYETGYAHALGKIVLLVTGNADDIPFDLKHYPHIIYESRQLSKLKDALLEKIIYFKDRRGLKPQKKENNLKIYINHTELTPNSVIHSTFTEEFNRLMKTQQRVIKLNISIHNKSNTAVKLPSKIAIYTSKDLFKYEDSILDHYDYTETPEGQSVISLHTGQALLPEDWANRQIEIAYSPSSPEHKQFELEIKIYTEENLVKIPCKLDVSC